MRYPSKKHKKNLVNWIASLLSRFPECRDNDRNIIVNIWNREIKDITKPVPEDLKELKVLYFFDQGLLSSPESIRRIRQKLQESHPELRSKKWRQRQKHAKTIRETINKPGNHEIKYSY